MTTRKATCSLLQARERQAVEEDDGSEQAAPRSRPLHFDALDQYSTAIPLYHSASLGQVTHSVFTRIFLLVYHIRSCQLLLFYHSHNLLYNSTFTHLIASPFHHSAVPLIQFYSHQTLLLPTTMPAHFVREFVDAVLTPPHGSLVFLAFQPNREGWVTLDKEAVPRLPAEAMASHSP